MKCIPFDAYPELRKLRYSAYDPCDSYVEQARRSEEIDTKNDIEKIIK